MASFLFLTARISIEPNNHLGKPGAFSESSTSLLGLTVGCAQCHNHRYDPISQQDYYQFRAIFEPAYDWKNWLSPQKRRASLYSDADRAKAADIEKKAKESTAARLTTDGSAQIPPNDVAVQTSGRRLAYARSLTDGQHPLLARVNVNRVWMHHFGRGIVATPADFGFLGTRPSHPRLLDWLADEFVQSGWSLKKLHRQIMNSSVYRQSSRISAEGQAIDAENRLLWRMPVRRLEAEVIRDSMLALGDQLNGKQFGPAVPVMADLVGQFVIGKENLNAGRPGAVIPMNGEELRRSVYIQVRRSRPLSKLEAFDLPRMEPNCASRSSSTVAPSR